MSNRFVKVKDTTLKALDPYRRLPEFDAEREEPLMKASNVAVVGPFVVELRGTADRALKQRFPMLMVNLGFVEAENGANMVTLGSPSHFHGLQVKGRVTEQDGRLVANTVDWGQIVIRPMVSTDAKLFGDPQITPEDNEAAMTRWFFSGNKTSLDPAEEEEE